MSVEAFKEFRQGVAQMPGGPLPPLADGESWTPILEKLSEAPPFSYKAWRRIVPVSCIFTSEGRFRGRLCEVSCGFN